MINTNIFNGKRILITGGTGTFGRAFTKYLLDNYDVQQIYIYSRDEFKQDLMREEFGNSIKISFLIGDIKDYQRLKRTFYDIDFVIHAAAQKQVPSCEDNPFEAIQTNILGAMNVANAAIDCKVRKVVALSTDKAVNPINLYGGTKMCLEKIFINGNCYSTKYTTMSCVRYGNVLSSRGSVIPKFKQQIIDKNVVNVTDKDMTRFFMKIEQAIEIVIHALINMKGSEIFIPKIKSIKILDLVEAINGNTKIKFTGIRQGEKINEILISEDESCRTEEFENYFIVYKNKESIKNIKEHSILNYTSDNEDLFYTVDEMRNIIND
jgi:UDP-N-acetylglucosamine 4,6-dehydratase